MKKFYLSILLFLLFFIPSTLQAAYPIGTVQKSSTLLLSQSQTISTYKILGEDYVPAISLMGFGAQVYFSAPTSSLIISSPTPSSAPTKSPSFNLENKPFSFYEGHIQIGDFKTHGVICDNRILIPLGALRSLWSIHIEGNNYTLTPTASLPVQATLNSISNRSSLSTSVEVTDIYYADGFQLKTSSYLLAPYETYSRNILAPEGTGLYISTLITKLTNSDYKYTNTNLFGQNKLALFSYYSDLLNHPNLNDIGDPIEFASIKKVEDIVNTKALTSDTKYLVWTSISDQRTYIFEKKANDWKLFKSFLCSTGKAHSPTPTGSYKLTRKVAYFGVEKGYRCKNAFGFIGTTYLYHSVMFDKTGSYLLPNKGNLGTAASGGCVRLSVEHSEWFYNNMISGTTVWIN